MTDLRKNGVIGSDISGMSAKITELSMVLTAWTTNTHPRPAFDCIRGNQVFP